MEPYVGEIRLFGFNFAPVNWALCDGSLISIQSYTTLFAILGTTYGGNGQTTFGLPNLQGSVMAGVGQGPGLANYILGEEFGSATVTLTTGTMAAHTHAIPVGSNATVGLQPSSSSYLASAPGEGRQPGAQLYATSAQVSSSPLSMGASAPAGSGGAHNNLSPYLVLNYCIATTGIFPVRS